MTSNQFLSWLAGKPIQMPDEEEEPVTMETEKNRLGVIEVAGGMFNTERQIAAN